MQNFYVAPDGSDDNTGTLNSPFATIQKAHDSVQAGDTIYLRGGTYTPPVDQITKLTKSGTKAAPIRLFAYKDETPVIDGKAWTRRTTAGGGKALIEQYGDHWHVKGLEMINSSRSAYVGFSVSNSIFENLNLHDNDNSGLNLQGEGTENDLILGGDFYRNYDPFRKGQDADGINFKNGSGKGNVIRGVRLYANSDDGVDFYGFKDSITIEDSWAYENGIDRWNVGPAFDGDGSGFRLAGGEASDLTNLSHIVRNNVAWGNPGRGFNYNSSIGTMQVDKNTAYNNGVNFAFNRGKHQLRNNLSVNGDIQREDGIDDRGNSWTLDINANEQDFLSTDDSKAKGKRQADGSLPDTDFLRLKADSDLIDADINAGNPFVGSAPDLGAFEYMEASVQPDDDSQPDPDFVPLPVPDPVPLPDPDDDGDSSSDDENNLIADYGFDNMISDVVIDGSLEGKDNSGRLYGATREEGITGRHIVLDGDDRVEIPNSRDINLGIQQQRTVSLWFKVDNETLDTRKQMLYEEGAGVRGLNAYVYDDRLYVGGWNNPSKESGWKGTWINTDQIVSDKWHHLAVVLDGGPDVSSNAIAGYLDGKIFGSGEGSQLWSHGGGIGLGSVNRGTRFHDGIVADRGNGLAGALNDVKIFNSALSAGQIETIAST